ncbi:hypothetical protein [Staphylococcus hominis]|uniref:hypothetical protein n=1 Tax=Staphylococcus hominis TaxID=1290 RepID=UPI002552D521|nr:hypothetical protein [Staphylococcus hominis]MDK7299518.1 hypothetical protein [Staphylococcus hominis]
MAEVKLSQESYDELLSDIEELRLQSDTYFEQWQKAKRKAEAFDEIKEMVSWFEENDRYEFEGQVGKIIKIIKGLERGSDE